MNKMNKKLGRVILIFIGILILIISSYCYNIYKMEDPPYYTPKEYRQSKINLNIIQQHIIYYKLKNNFDEQWFKLLYHAKNSNIDFKNQLIALGIEKMKSDQILPYVIFQGIFFPYTEEQFNFLKSLDINNIKNRNKFLDSYCTWGLFLDTDLFYNGVKGKNPYKENSFIIKNKKNHFNIKTHECTYITSLISGI